MSADIKRIKSDIASSLKGYKRGYDVSHAGTVLYAGDGIVKISGLQDAWYGELLTLEGGVDAIALNLEEKEVGAVLLGDDSKVLVGSLVHASGRMVEVPVGDALLGRVVSPLGEPLDGQGDIRATEFRAVESPAPAINDRGKVNTPLETGILAIDAMIPIGRGQRELIIGDRQTGKTSIAIDAILNQRGKNVLCVYVSIGQKASTISSIVHTLGEHNALAYTTVVCSTARDAAPLQYLAPYSGCAIAEAFMYAGKDVLIVYDDLSKHAVAYRAMSLLLKRPPGREAFPGDIFYLHSRLLERAAKLSEAKGGGSLTALPIVETQAGDISAYIPTNVISITDGQIYLESELFNAGIRPAVNVGLSVSRVGGSAQITAMRKISGKLRLDLSQYRELAVFAQFGSELDSQTQALLKQGESTTEMLKQPLLTPYPQPVQVVLLYITIKEFVKGIPLKQLSAFARGFVRLLASEHPDVLSGIACTGELSAAGAADIEA
ncbi:MAG: F0F1 ATP synthase subunit alpha, partial [Clostridiales bacterium]|nr:F0F1 ATP synthase subunit alpha [Clostridiales bacterium]